MNANNDFICVKCKNHDTGVFCSKCGRLLQINNFEIFDLLELRLLENGYIDKKLLIENETYLKHIKVLNDIFIHAPLYVKKILFFDYSSARRVEVFFIISIDHINNMTDFEEYIIRINHNISNKKLDLQALTYSYKIHNILCRYLFITNIDEATSIETVIKLQAKFSSKLNFGNTFSLLVHFYSLSLKSSSIFHSQLPKVGIFKGGLSGEGILFPKNSIIQSLKQLEEYKDPNAKISTKNEIYSSIYSQILEEPISKIKTFFISFFNLFSKPMYYAREIEKGNIKFKDILIYLILCVFFVVLLEKVFSFTGYEGVFSQLEIGIPIIDDILPLIFLLVTNLFGSLILHPFFKIVGGKAKFSMTFYIISLTSIFTIVLGTVLEIFISFFITMDPKMLNAFYNGLGGSTYSIIMAPMMSVVHHISIRKSFFAYFLFIASFIVLIIISVLIYWNSIR